LQQCSGWQALAGDAINGQGEINLKCRELHRTGFNARLRDELLSGEVFRLMASEMLLRSQRKLHHAFQELVRWQADKVVHDELLGV
jgi:hypothetical protein